MDKERWQLRFRRPVLLITYAILLFLIGWNFDKTLSVIKTFLSICLPVQIGLILAFMVNLPLRMWEALLKDRGKNKHWTRIRPLLCIVLAYLTFLAFIGLLFLLLVPELIDNFETLGANISYYINSLDRWINSMVVRFDIDSELISNVDDYLRQFINWLAGWVQSNTSQLFSLTKDIGSALYSAFVGVIISALVLAQKKRLFRQAERLCHALFRDALADRLVQIGSMSCNTFNQYIAGQFIESLILGTLCFIGMNLFGMPYAPIISVVICICNMVPLVGSLLGTVPCALLIFMIDPMTAIWFVIFIVVLQQLENNLIYPRVVGSSVGISGLWVILAVIIFGGIFGVLGVFLGVPAMAVIYRLVSEFVQTRLQAKKAVKEAQPEPESSEASEPSN